MIEYFASLKPIATWRLAVFRFLRFLYWKLPSPVQSYIRSPANRLLNRLGIDKFAYIYAKLTQIPSPVKDYYPDFQPLWDSLLLIIAGMPMDNVGGGQRSAQIAKAFSDKYIISLNRLLNNLIGLITYAPSWFEDKTLSILYASCGVRMW